MVKVHQTTGVFGFSFRHLSEPLHELLWNMTAALTLSVYSLERRVYGSGFVQACLGSVAANGLLVAAVVVGEFS